MVIACKSGQGTVYPFLFYLMSIISEYTYHQVLRNLTSWGQGHGKLASGASLRLQLQLSLYQWSSASLQLFVIDMP